MAVPCQLRQIQVWLLFSAALLGTCILPSEGGRWTVARRSEQGRLALTSMNRETVTTAGGQRLLLLHESGASHSQDLWAAFLPGQARSRSVVSSGLNTGQTQCRQLPPLIVRSWQESAPCPPHWLCMGHRMANSSFFSLGLEFD